MRRGEVWVGNLNPARGAEIGKVRPVVVLQDDPFLKGDLATVVVLPMTTQLRQGFQFLRVTIPARDRLEHASQVIVDKPRTLDRKRFGDGPLTRLTEDEMAAVERGLRGLLGL